MWTHYPSLIRRRNEGPAYAVTAPKPALSTAVNDLKLEILPAAWPLDSDASTEGYFHRRLVRLSADTRGESFRRSRVHYVTYSWRIHVQGLDCHVQ